MTLSGYLDALAGEMGGEALRGAIAFVSLDRGVDRLIQLALGLGPYHPGKASPWSHTFLLADAYAGPGTPILDCTIRTADGKIDWDEDLGEVLKTGITRCGGIYDGAVGDYDDPRVKSAGVKVVQGLPAHARVDVAAAGRALQSLGYHYDVPGLVRELARLAWDVPIRAGDKLLFCSAFCQAAYRNAIGGAGDFAPAIRTEDVTPDDLWYSPLGTGFLPPD